MTDEDEVRLEKITLQELRNLSENLSKIFGTRVGALFLKQFTVVKKNRVNTMTNYRVNENLSFVIALFDDPKTNEIFISGASMDSKNNQNSESLDTYKLFSITEDNKVIIHKKQIQEFQKRVREDNHND